jgi:hypothetical protein
VIDFKNPVNGTATYRLCVYDGSANAQPLMEADVPPGGTCGTQPCWRAIGATGFGYRNKPGTPNGITSLTLRAGATGRAKVQAKGRGSNLATPALGLSLPVKVQLVIRDGAGTECWQTSFTAARANGPGKFSAKGP